MPFLGERHQNIFMVSWTRRRALLNWRTLRSGGVFWLRGAAAISQQARAAEGLLGNMSSRSILEGGCRGKILLRCVPGLPAMVIFRRGAFSGLPTVAIFRRDAPRGALADGKMLANCALRRPTVARYRRGAFPGGDPWQLFRFMRSRRGFGREKRPFLAAYRRRASETSRLRQDMRAVHPKSAANGRSGMHGANILP